MKSHVLLVTIYSVGHFFDEGKYFPIDVPTFTKKVIKFVRYYLPIFSDSIITFELCVYWFIFPFINDSLNHLPQFFHVRLMFR